MQLGYYWGKYNGEWVFFRVVAGLHGAVLLDGFSVALDRLSEIGGPWRPPPEPGCTQAWIMPPVMAEPFHIDCDED